MSDEKIIDSKKMREELRQMTKAELIEQCLTAAEVVHKLSHVAAGLSGLSKAFMAINHGLGEGVINEDEADAMGKAYTGLAGEVMHVGMSNYMMAVGAVYGPSGCDPDVEQFASAMALGVLIGAAHDSGFDKDLLNAAADAADKVINQVGDEAVMVWLQADKLREKAKLADIGTTVAKDTGGAYDHVVMIDAADFTEKQDEMTDSHRDYIAHVIRKAIYLQDVPLDAVRVAYNHEGGVAKVGEFFTEYLHREYIPMTKEESLAGPPIKG